jgi:hypothetical protein
MPPCVISEKQRRVKNAQSSDGPRHVLHSITDYMPCVISEKRRRVSSGGPHRVPVGAAVISHYVSKCLLKCAHILKCVRHMCAHVRTYFNCAHNFQFGSCRLKSPAQFDICVERGHAHTFNWRLMCLDQSRVQRNVLVQIDKI